MPENEQKMDSIRNCIIFGEDFGELAKKYSSDQYSAQTGGDLGMMWVGRFPYSFEDAAYSTPIGQVSKVVKSPFGYHVIKVNGENGSRGFKVRAYMGEKGVYVAYEAVSNTVVTDHVTEWWQNVNIEAGFVTSNGNRTVVRIATNGALSDKVSNCWLYKFKIEKTGGYYKTTLEFFVPYSVIGYAGTEDFVVGYFAFDPGAESATGINTEIENGVEVRRDSEFWFGHTWAHPHAGVYADAEKTYKITANGLVGSMITVVA